MEAVNLYINAFPGEIQKKLHALRDLIRTTISELTEGMGYGIPSYKLKGRNFIHFAGYQKHIGLYPGPKAVSYFADKLLNYKTSKGAVQFPLDDDLPLNLIKEIVLWCMTDSQQKR